MDYPTKREIQDRASRGEPISQDEASSLEREESDMTGSGPIPGGTAATAQSVHDSQMNFIAKASEIARKSKEDITEDDAAEIQKREARALGGADPGEGSASSYVQSIADQNERYHRRVSSEDLFMQSPSGHRRSM